MIVSLKSQSIHRQCPPELQCGRNGQGMGISAQSLRLVFITCIHHLGATCTPPKYQKKPAPRHNMHAPATIAAQLAKAASPCICL